MTWNYLLAVLEFLEIIFFYNGKEKKGQETFRTMGALTLLSITRWKKELNQYNHL